MYKILIPENCPHCDCLLISDIDEGSNEVQWRCAGSDRLCSFYNFYCHNGNIVGFQDAAIINDKILVIKSETSSTHIVIKNFILITEFENNVVPSFSKKVYRDDYFVEYEDRWKFLDKILKIKAFL